MVKRADNAVVRSLLALIALGSAGAGQYWLALAFDPRRAALGWSIAAVVFVALYFIDAEGRALPAVTETVPPKIEWALALVVFAVGLFYRTFRLSELPPGLNHDCAWEGLYAVRILQGLPYAPYTPEAWGRETFMFYWDAVAVKLFGLTLFSITLPAVVAMVLMIPFLYWWARSMFGTRAALVVTFFLAVGGWPLISGRVGWRAVLQPLFATITCLFFWRGMVTARVREFVLSGAALALTLNTYNGARALPLLFPLYVIAYLIRHGRVREFVRRYWLGFAEMVVAFAIVVTPLAWYAIHNWEIFQGRAGALYTGPGQLLHSVTAGLLLFNYRGNGDDFVIDTPLLGLPAAVLFVFGVLWCLLRVRDERAVFLLLGLFLGLLPGMVTIKPNGNRCIGAMVFTYYFVGLGLLYFVRQARRIGRAGPVVAMVLLLVGAGADARATFAEYLSHNRRFIWGFYPETTVLGHYLRTLVGKYAIWVGGANFPRDALTFLSYPGQGDPFERRYTWLDDVTVLLRQPPQPPPGRGLAVVLSTIDQGPPVFAQMLQRYPVHELVDIRYPEKGGGIFARAMLVPPDQVAHPAAEVKLEPPPGEPLWSGGHGFALGQFDTPKGLARGTKGEFYVADTANHRVQKFDAKGAFVAVWGQLGPTPGLFNEPSAVAVDADGNVHVVDTWNHRIQRLSPEGKVLSVYTPPEGFFGPRGIAIGKKNIYVTDGGHNYVYVFDLNGAYVSKFGGPGHDTGQLFQPVGVAIDAQGLVWVVDSGNNRLQAFRADGTSAAVVPVPGWHDDQIKEGHLLATDAGLVFSDPVENRLFLLKDHRLAQIDAPALSGPSGLAWGKPTLYVSERGRNAVARVPLK